MSDGEVAARKPITGRTAWDAISEVSLSLGPWVVCAFVGLWLVGELFSRTQEQSNAANESLRSTYEQLGSLSGQMIGNVKSLLDLHNDVIKSTESHRTELNKLQNQEMDTSRKLASAAEEIEKTKKEHGRLKDSIEELKKQLVDKTGELEKSKSAIGNRAVSIEQLRQQLSELVEQILGEEPDEDEIRNLAESIRGDLLVDPRSVLEAYAASTTPVDTKALDTLIGVDGRRLDEVIKQTTGFQSWHRVVDHGGVAVIGVTAVADDRLPRVIGLTMGPDAESLTYRVVDVDTMSDVYLVRAISSDQWDEMCLYRVSNLDGWSCDSIPDPAPGTRDACPAAEILLVEEVESLECLAGKVQSLRVWTTEDFARDHGDVLGQLDADDELRLAMLMEQRAEAPELAKLFSEAGLDKLPANVRDIVREALHAAVLRGTELRKSGQARTFDDVADFYKGQVAAALLRGSLAIERLENEPADPSSLAAASELRLRVQIETEWSRDEAVIVLQRIGPQAAWQVIDLAYSWEILDEPAAQFPEAESS